MKSLISGVTFFALLACLTSTVGARAVGGRQDVDRRQVEDSTTEATTTTESSNPSVCEDLTIPVQVTATVEGTFSIEEYNLDTLYAFYNRSILVDGDYTLSARFCQPAPEVVAIEDRKDTIQILVHGATFNKVMWDFPYEPDTYSWVRYMNRAGYSTLAVDVLGAGNSTKPHGYFEAHAETYVQNFHSVIQQVRSEGILGHTFSKIAFAGFSVGGTIANGIANRFPQDVDIFILLGITWYFDDVYPAFLAGLQSAASAIDPEQWGELDEFYLAHGTRGARRVSSFYGDYDEGAEIEDYRTRDTDTYGAAVTFTYHLIEAPEFTGPVFLGIGDHDATFCGIKCGSEPYAVYDKFPAASDHQVRVYPEAGHQLMYHRCAPDVMADSLAFLERHENDLLSEGGEETDDTTDQTTEDN